MYSNIDCTLYIFFVPKIPLLSFNGSRKYFRNFYNDKELGTNKFYGNKRLIKKGRMHTYNRILDSWILWDVRLYLLT